MKWILLDYTIASKHIQGSAVIDTHEDINKTLVGEEEPWGVDL